MSSFFPCDLPCTACGESHQVQLFRGIFGARLAHVRQQVIKRTFHRFACPACQHVTTAQSQLVFSDFGKHELVVVLPRVHVQEVRRQVEERYGSFAAQLAHEAGLLEIVQGETTCRVVFGYEAWREKLVAWDAGLDDYVLEAIKADRNIRHFNSPWAQQWRLTMRAAEGHFFLRNVTAAARPEVYPVLVVPAAEYEMRAASIDTIAIDYPWLHTKWLVDSYDAEVSPHHLPR